MIKISIIGQSAFGESVAKEIFKMKETIISSVFGGLIAIINTSVAEKRAPLSQIKVLSFKEKGEWDLQAKYTIGNVSIKTTKEPSKGKSFDIGDEFAI